jgi:hypothetical protein
MDEVAGFDKARSPVKIVDGPRDGGRERDATCECGELDEHKNDSGDEQRCHGNAAPFTDERKQAFVEL